MSKKYPLPFFLVGQVSQTDYERWLHRKARAHVRRDHRRINKRAVGQEYRTRIHEAVDRSRGLDAYTGEQLQWRLISKYNNDESHRLGCRYKRRFALLPTLDHVGEGKHPVDFNICAWRTNDAKSDLKISEFLTLCRTVLVHHGYTVVKSR